MKEMVSLKFTRKKSNNKVTDSTISELNIIRVNYIVYCHVEVKQRMISRNLV